MLNKLAKKLQLTTQELKERLNVSDDVTESELLKALGFEQAASYLDILSFTKNLMGNANVDISDMGDINNIVEKLTEDLTSQTFSNEEQVKKMNEMLSKMNSFSAQFFGGDINQDKVKEEDKQEPKPKNKKDFS
ncbi:hypothetical protein [Mycoplasma sp. E35C]|uniref:hypothetical protein n=1 Tax=Mycoplasma sp. E35C TaxID=2801918 RepID=UPI001CA39029|nr:hypothetical protein [Mycoplasma sp. E35C]QZX48808.1 hypothetical protein JJE79_01980 [Mycoplasma sp. E35C]